MSDSAATTRTKPSSSPPAHSAALPAWFERMVTLMDDAVRVPGTQFRFGLDAVLGLVLPGVGDALGNLSNVFLVGFALRHGVPAPIVLRMGINTLLDALWAAVPLLGDVGDAWFKANRRNFRLLQRYSQEGRVRRGDWLVISMVVVLLLLALALPLLLVAWVATALLS